MIIKFRGKTNNSLAFRLIVESGDSINNGDGSDFESGYFFDMSVFNEKILLNEEEYSADPINVEPIYDKITNAYFDIYFGGLDFTSYFDGIEVSAFESAALDYLTEIKKYAINV